MLCAMSATETVLHVTTPPPSGPEAFEAFRETFGKTIMRIEVDPRADDPFAMDMVFRALPRFGFSAGWLSGVDTHRTTALIDNDDPVLVAFIKGSGELEQLGRTVSIRDGEAVLTTGGERGRFSCAPRTHFMSFRFNRVRLSGMVADLDGALAIRIPAGNPVLRLLTAYAAGLEGDSPIGADDVQRAVGLHAHDLAALLVGGAKDGAAVAHRGIRAARFTAIKRTIRERLAEQTLSIESVADAHGISASYVRKLLADHDTTFSAFLLGERLVRAHRLLLEPGMAIRTISDIAYEAGFGDLSYFNRTFRRRFGMTPRDLRRGD